MPGWSQSTANGRCKHLTTVATVDEKTHFTQERKSSYSSSSSSSSDTSLKRPRTPRFAEATTVYSPVDPIKDNQSLFADPPKTQLHMNRSDASDLGFGYISQSCESRDVPAEMSLKSALKVPGTPGRMIDNPLSPTFREEQILERQEVLTEKEQANDLKIKTRVRIAKFVLRGVNFSCSLIVLAMVSMTFSIFNATKTLPPRNSLPAWAVGTKTWPQILILVVSCISLAFCLIIFWNYWREGHRKAEKVAVYYTLFAVAFFIFSTIMWAIAAGILQGAKTSGHGKDMWGWSCVDNKRRELFSEKVDYALVCRMQNWSLVCCIIEIVLESITIILYAIVFYRYYSKQRLRKSMDIRDRARSDLYLAKLRSKSAPNTPGFGPLSPSYGENVKSPRFPMYATNLAAAAEEGAIGVNTRFVEAKPVSELTTKPFALQPPPIKFHAATPKTPQTNFTPQERVIQHTLVAPGEQTYDAVPIPSAYPAARNVPQQHARFDSVGEAITSDVRIESPPGSPRGWR